MRVFADLGTLVTYFLLHSLFALTAGKISTGMGRAKGKEGLDKLLYQLPSVLLMPSSNPARSQHLVRREGFPFVVQVKLHPL